MASPSAKRKPAKPARKPVYFDVENVAVLKTGEQVKALVAHTGWDRRAMQDRKYKSGDVVRAMLTKPRNEWLHNISHALGAVAVDHIEGYEGMQAHDALKRLQRESGICCDESVIDAAPVVDAILAASEQVLGAAAATMLRAVLPEIKTVTVKTAQSIAYDEMDQSEFRKLALGICQYIRETFEGVPPGELSLIVEKIEQSEL